MKDTPLTKEQLELLNKYLYVSTVTTDQAFRKYGMYVNYNELLSASYEGLIHAIQHAKEDQKGIKSYCFICAKGSIITYLRQRVGAKRTKKDGYIYPDYLSLDYVYERESDFYNYLSYDNNDLDTKIMIRSAIEKLPEKHKFIIDKVLQGYNMRQIGNELDCTKQYVHILYQSALKMLKEDLRSLI